MGEFAEAEEAARKIKALTSKIQKWATRAETEPVFKRREKARFKAMNARKKLAAMMAAYDEMKKAA